jgi:hypothetical protein
MTIAAVAQRYIFGKTEIYEVCGTNSFPTSLRVSGASCRDQCFVLLHGDCFDNVSLDSQLQLYDFQGALMGMDFGCQYKYNSLFYP